VSEAASGPKGGAGYVGLRRGTGHRFGSGWISGVLSVTCGALGYGGVLCLLFPSFLTTPSARALYPLDLVRFLIYVMLVLGFALGALSVVLRRRRVLGFTGIALATAGTLLGGSTAEVGTLVYAYLIFVSFLAVFIHANVRLDLRALDWVLVTPRFHHWHHAASPVDKNFAVHLPWLDLLFGTAYLPAARWPAAYGIEGHPVPEGYWRQLAWPFRP
jgi:Fatty acid hydroxylase superfamily